MADELEVKISGLSELQSALEKLPEKLAKKDLRAAGRAGANVFKNALVVTAPRETNFEADHIDIRSRMRRDALAVTFFIGPNNKVIRPERVGRFSKITHKPWRQWTAALVARFLELGTSRHAKFPWLTQAFTTEQQKAVDAVIEKLKSSLGI